jgi:hypothetical protein
MANLHVRQGPLVGKGFTSRERRIARFVSQVCTEDYGFTPHRLVCAELVRKHWGSAKRFDEELACFIVETEEATLRASVARTS